jgi:hypothetical protein
MPDPLRIVLIPGCSKALLALDFHGGVEQHPDEFGQGIQPIGGQLFDEIRW